MNKDVVIIDYGSGNLRSAAKAFERCLADNDLKGKVTVSSDHQELGSASHIVLPGVGAFADCRRGLGNVPGMVEALTTHVIEGGKPFLGICVGMQLMADVGLEHGSTEGLGWIAGEVEALKPSDKTLKIPHMGWNNLDFSPNSHVLLEDIEPGDHAYFVHSYQYHCKSPKDCFATVDYAGSITALIAHDNMAGTQFHPEKSQQTGLTLIRNFLKWNL